MPSCFIDCVAKLVKCDGGGAATIRRRRKWSFDDFDGIEIRRSSGSSTTFDGAGVCRGRDRDFSLETVTSLHVSASIHTLKSVEERQSQLLLLYRSKVRRSKSVGSEADSVCDTARFIRLIIFVPSAEGIDSNLTSELSQLTAAQTLYSQQQSVLPHYPKCYNLCITSSCCYLKQISPKAIAAYSWHDILSDGLERTPDNI